LCAVKGEKQMEFIKKYWSKLVLAIAMSIGAILMIVPLFTAPKFQFLGACQILGLVLFFLGMATYYILKMCEMKKMVTAVALLTTGVLSLIVLVTGAFGFMYKNADETTHKGAKDGQGVFGRMYASSDAAYKQAVKDGEVAFQKALAKADVKKSLKLTALATDTDAQTKIGAAIEKFKADNASKPAYVETAEDFNLALLGSYAAAYKYGTKLTAGETLTEAEQASLTWGDALNGIKLGYGYGYGVTQTSALVILFTYISLILVMGLVPTVVGAKKLICACNGCECGKTAPAAPAYSAPVAAPAAAAAPKAPSAKK
jgi:hypothetical protein